MAAKERVSFRQVNRQTGNRLRQQLVDSVTGEPVPSSNKGRGYEVGENQFLLIGEDELEAAEQEARSRPYSAAPPVAASQITEPQQHGNNVVSAKSPSDAEEKDLLDNLRTAMGKRSESLGVIISTQAATDQHPLSQMIDDAALGVDPALYLQLDAAPPDADIFDERTWFACNEALGKFLDLSEFRTQAKQAKRLPSFRAKFENLRLNKRIDANLQFISDADWMACAAPLDMAGLAGKPCYAGLDLSQTTDMSALVLYWPHNGAVVAHFWLPEEGLLDRDRKEGGHYRTWRDTGLLETTPGRAINFRAIIRRLAEINAEYDLVCVAYDRAFIKTFRARCDELGVALPLREFGQGFMSMSPAVQLLEAAVLDRRIHHGGHPILRWQVSNVAIEMDPSANRKPSKKRATGHIDGVVSLMMALGAAVQPAPKIDVAALIA